MIRNPRVLPSWHRLTLLVGISVTACVLLLTGLRAASAAGPEDVVRALADSAIAIMSDEGLDAEARDARFRELLTAHFDLERIGRFSLGKYWKTATEEERAEYRRLFADYIMAVYVARLDSYSDVTLTIVGSRMKGNGSAVVGSRFQRPDAEPVQVNWRLRRNGETWQIIDLVVEGVSLTITQRIQFDSVIRRSGGRVEALLAKLREFAA